MKQLLISVPLMLASIGSATAGPAEDAARTHFAAIGSGDTQVLMRGYAENAQLNWVGGPLDGTYTGKASIQTVWEKFGKNGLQKVTVN